jgi:hypothetical protein
MVITRSGIGLNVQLDVIIAEQASCTPHPPPPPTRNVLKQTHLSDRISNVYGIYRPVPFNPFWWKFPEVPHA